LGVEIVLEEATGKLLGPNIAANLTYTPTYLTKWSGKQQQQQQQLTGGHLRD